jgi:AcrR family transcriptional regulator
MSQNKNTILFHSLAKLHTNVSLSDITIAELTADAGVSRMYFYRHFNTYMDIIDLHIEDLVTDFMCAVRKQPDSIEHTATLFFRILLPDAKSFGVFLAHDESNHIQHNFELGLQRLLDQNLIQGQRDPYWQAFIAGGLSRIITVWLSKSEPETPMQMGTKIAAIVR